MKRAFTLLEFVVVSAILVLLVALLFPIFARVNPAPKNSICRSNLKQIGLGFLQYTQDFGERYPPAQVTPISGWKDVVFPYIKSERVFQCPSTRGSTPPLTDYFYNRRLARLKSAALGTEALTILAGDGADDAPTWNSVTQLPASWETGQGAPSLRHLGAASYLFADGHVKLLKPSKVSTTSPSPMPGRDATFATK